MTTALISTSRLASFSSSLFHPLNFVVMWSFKYDNADFFDLPEIDGRPRYFSGFTFSHICSKLATISLSSAWVFLLKYTFNSVAFIVCHEARA